MLAAPLNVITDKIHECDSIIYDENLEPTFEQLIIYTNEVGT